MKKYPDAKEFYRRKEAGRKAAAKRPLTEKLAAVTKLRDLEKSLAPLRAANKVRRASKQIKIHTKTA
ncbi:MAG: hypothetical protein ABR568_18875 [Pyrinomonadaceae bacterium]